jgi:pyruvate dehydrogenase E2 component (dihydrolipoamide acetyltransferase)
MAEFRMPSLGADMTEGTLTRWLVAPGDRVARGDIVAEVETDKADMEVEVFEDGVVARLLVAEGERVPVGTPLALIGEGVTAGPAPAIRAAIPAAAVVEPARREALAPTPAAPRRGAEPPRATPTARALAEKLGVDLAMLTGTGISGAVTRGDVERAASARPAAAGTGRARVSPYARRLAGELHVDLATVRGSGPGGAVTAADVEAAAGAPQPPAPTPPRPARPAERRGPIVALMERSNREIPHYYLGLDVDMSRALKWLENENAQRPVTGRVLYSALLLKAVALAAREVPEVNGYWREGRFEPGEAVNVGVAISLRGGGVVAPAIAGASERPLTEVMSALRDLVGRARSGKLRASELTCGTITVTNLGELGVDAVHGVIYPPQVALVGFGRITERAWAEAGMLAARPVITATLAADHRASDGHRGGIFLTAVERLLKEPERL